jgi:hypothetical protein
VLVRDWPLPAGLPAGAAVSALTALADRHDGLRCVLDLGDPGRPARVLRDGPPTVVLGEDGAAPPLDLEHGPLWTAAVPGPGAAVRVRMHYLVANARPMEILQAEFGALLDGRPLPPAPSSFDLADAQASARWAPRRAAAAARWSAFAAALPPDPDRMAAVAGATTRWARLRSVPALGAAQQVAGRAGVSVPSVVLAALCRQVAGSDPVAGIGLLAGNRTMPRWRDVVCPMDQLVPLTFGSRPGEPLTATAGRVHYEALTAYAAGMYDPDEVAAVLARHGIARLEAGLAGIFSWVGEAPDRPADADAAGWTVEAQPSGTDNGVGGYLRASVDDGALLLRLEQRSPGADDRTAPDMLGRLHAELVAAAG